MCSGLEEDSSVHLIFSCKELRNVDVECVDVPNNLIISSDGTVGRQIANLRGVVCTAPKCRRVIGILTLEAVHFNGIIALFICRGIILHFETIS